jgi:hypothetical protein
MLQVHSILFQNKGINVCPAIPSSGYYEHPHPRLVWRDPAITSDRPDHPVLQKDSEFLRVFIPEY